jgi:hypothetical protein
VSPATTITPYRSTARDARDGFGQLLHAEWTKFRTVRGWIIGMIVAALITGGLGVLVAEASANVTCQASNGPVRHGAACGSGDHRLLGPGGEPVQDQFYFVRQPLAGNGSLTVEVTSLTEVLPRSPGYGQPGLVPWAKAGIIISDGTSHGSAYAAMMVTGGNGGADAVELHRGHARTARRRLCGEPALAAAHPRRRHDHRL